VRGGAVGITEQDLERNYATLCDPRLNYRQALEMSFRIARRMSRLPHASGAEPGSSAWQPYREGGALPLPRAHLHLASERVYHLLDDVEPQPHAARWPPCLGVPRWKGWKSVARSPAGMGSPSLCTESTTSLPLSRTLHAHPGCPSAHGAGHCSAGCPTTCAQAIRGPTTPTRLRPRPIPTAGPGASPGAPPARSGRCRQVHPLAEHRAAHRPRAAAREVEDVVEHPRHPRRAVADAIHRARRPPRSAPPSLCSR